jgi:hypothetical protein
MANLVLICLVTVLVLLPDMCTICAKRTMGLGSFWMKQMELLGDETQ